MVRSIELIFLNEFRLLLRDRTALFMIFVAPVVIIAVAGFSLGNLFGSPTSYKDYLLAVVDEDRGRIASAIVVALERDPRCKLVKVDDVDSARRVVLDHAQGPLAIVIPPNTTAAFESGQTAPVEVLVDPVKRLQASAIELRLNNLSQTLASAAQAQVQREFARDLVELRADLERADAQSKALNMAIRDYHNRLGRARDAAQQVVQAEVQRQLDTLKAESQASIAQAMALTREGFDRAMADRQRSLLALQGYFRALSKSKAEFDRWFAQLKRIAGSKAGLIPPPPQLPLPPSPQQLAELTKPPSFSIVQPPLPSPNFAKVKLSIPQPPPLPSFSLNPPKALMTNIDFPGAIAWKAKSITPNSAEGNAFELYVPGFGVTFLLIDMLWEVSVALMDERQWGTLRRLRLSGAPAAGMLIGRLSARTLIGFLQMIVLFGVGWLLFDINLGSKPAMLMLPAGAIAFAAAAFGLVLAVVAPSRDSVLPIGSVAAMVMSAVGGCWWPLDFEPEWMRTAALTVPTTWTMRAFNDLMIRGLDPNTVFWPTTMALGLGVIFLLGGIAGSTRLYR
jgi:ABC-type multidrug transport system permease subunit